MTISDILAGRRSLIESGVLRGSRDLHSHILHGVDDGIATARESLEALAFEESAGVKEVWCTPHIMEEVPNETAMLKQRFAQLQDLYTGAAGLHLGAEYMLDSLFLERLKKGDILTISDEIILVEASSAGAPQEFEKILAGVMSDGFRPMLAHPERYGFLKQKEYRRLHEMGVLFQLNIASLTGFYGRQVTTRAESLLKEGLYSAYGSDCHSLPAMKFQYTAGRLSADILRRIALLNANF